MTKNIQKRLFLCTLLLMQSILMLQVQSQNPVGAIPGVIDVSPMGAATYTIPIEVVPGTQGVQPNLSIVYNSFGGMGLLGMKWNLAGLSAITRCGQVPYYDNGNITSIQFTDGDRFSLDGERLILIGSQSPLEYATEIENYTRVYKYFSSGIPSYFKAYTDDGSIIEYGNTTNSKQQLGATINSTLSWLINKVTDVNGNYIVFNYDNQNGEVLINNIQYTGNTGLTTFAKVQFGYSLLPDSMGRSSCFLKGFMQTHYMDRYGPFPNRLDAYQWEFQQNLILRGKLNLNMH